MQGIPAVVTYAILTVLWGAIVVLYLRQRREARLRDPLVAMLLSVLALDAFKSLFESVYFGLLWGEQYGLFGRAMAVLGRPELLTAVKLMNVFVATTVLTRLVRQWVPSRLKERERMRHEEAALQARLEQLLREARENEERFRLAADLNELAVWDYDLRTGKLWLSRRYFEMLGHGEDGWPGGLEAWREAVHPDDAAIVFDKLGNICGDTVFRTTHRMRHADGSWRLVRGQGMPVRAEDGLPARLLGFSRDVTRETQEEEARQQGRKLESVGLLAGGVAHDFNNLLSVISTNLSLVQEHVGGAEAEAVRASLAAAARAATLTRQLLAYAGRARLVKEPVDVSALVSEIAGLLSAVISRKVRLIEELQRPLPAVVADPAQIQQMVMNLVTNASEAIGDQSGAITVRTAERTLAEADARTIDPAGVLAPGRCVVLTVEDTGCGMSRETQARIFDPFFTTKLKGRGLGLSAMAGTLRAHGGAVRIESAPGKGSRFEVFLPASGEAVAVNAVAPALAGVLRGSVLIVDDEPLLRRGSSRLLKRLGLTPVEAANGAEAVKLIADEGKAFDVVLMDLMMPEMGGAEALAAIRRVRPDLPVVLMSGYSEAPVEPGLATAFLPKPFDLAQVEAVMRAVLPGSRAG